MANYNFDKCWPQKTAATSLYSESVDWIQIFFRRGGVGVELLAVNSQMKVYWKTSSQVPAYQYKYIHASLAIPFSHKNRKDLM